ncbi:MAG: universal stress protein [Chloroflexi bacterium]|nr:universal stress protein [Chloroflexota bacterium]
MLATIMVPLDGSDFGARAVPYASTLARSSDAKLVLVRVLPHRAPGSAVDELEAIQAALNVDAEAMRAEGLHVEIVVRRVRPVHAEDVARAIAAIADEQGVGLIVMSTHGRSGLGRWLYGSVTDCILRQTAIPILLVPLHADRPLPIDRRIRVLVPLDGSELAEEAIESADLLAGSLDAELIILRVVEPPSDPFGDVGYAYVPYDQDVELAAARQYLQVQLDRLQAQDNRVTARATIGKPSSVVTQVARHVEADIVMMATHGRCDVARLVLGSVATATLQQADVPVLLVRPAAMLHSDSLRSGAQASAASATAASTTTADPVPTVDVVLNMADLELIERGLKALAYTPGYDYLLAPRIRALVNRLDSAVQCLEADERASDPEHATKR